MLNNNFRHFFIPETLIDQIEIEFLPFDKPLRLHYGVATRRKAGNVSKEEDAELKRALGSRTREELNFEEVSRLFATDSDFLLTDEAFFYFLPTFVRFGCKEGGQNIMRHLATRIKNTFERIKSPSQTSLQLTATQLEVLHELIKEEQKSPLSFDFEEDL